MSDDIKVLALRILAKQSAQREDELGKLLNDAADALEALVAERDEARSVKDTWCKVATEFKGERDRLKAALERLHNEKVAGAAALEAAGAGLSPASGQAPAADPAPVCGWRLDMLPEPDGGSHYETSCGDAWCRWYNTPKEDNYSYCPSCGGAIKFTEAAHDKANGVPDEIY